MHKEPSIPRPSSWQEEALEFEITGFDEARRVLDDESLSQFHVDKVMPPGHWERLRRAKLPTDHALTGRALDWLMALPPTVRPNDLTLLFPRITNALAEVWHEPHELQAALHKLLHDERKGRKGFPAAVNDELVALRDWTQVF